LHVAARVAFLLKWWPLRWWRFIEHAAEAEWKWCHVAAACKPNQGCRIAGVPGYGVPGSYRRLRGSHVSELYRKRRPR